MPAQLVALSEGPSILLDKPILLLGRHPECDIQIDSRKISRRHCCIAQVGEFLVVRDLGSTNGIRINGQRVLEGRLKAEDELTIGGFRYRVAWENLSDNPAKTTSDSTTPARHSAGARTARPLDEDLLLEASEEPVPLGEGPPLNGRPIPGRSPSKRHTPPHPVPPPPLPVEERPYSVIIPDDVSLAPASDLDNPEPGRDRRSP